MGLTCVLCVTRRVMILDQVLFLPEAVILNLIDMGMNVGGSVAFCTSLLFMVSQALTQVVGLPDVLRHPLSVSVELAENVVPRHLIEGGANRIDFVFIGFAGLTGPFTFV